MSSRERCASVGRRVWSRWGRASNMCHYFWSSLSSSSSSSSSSAPSEAMPSCLEPRPSCKHEHTCYKTNPQLVKHTRQNKTTRIHVCKNSFSIVAYVYFNKANSHHRTTGLLALTSAGVKSFKHADPPEKHHRDPQQFAYRTMDDAVNIWLYCVAHRHHCYICQNLVCGLSLFPSTRQRTTNRWG